MLMEPGLNMLIKSWIGPFCKAGNLHQADTLLNYSLQKCIFMADISKMQKRVAWVA